MQLGTAHPAYISKADTVNRKFDETRRRPFAYNFCSQPFVEWPGPIALTRHLPITRLLDERTPTKILGRLLIERRPSPGDLRPNRTNERRIRLLKEMQEQSKAAPDVARDQEVLADMFVAPFGEARSDRGIREQIAAFESQREKSFVRKVRAT
jgi:hypothetical protein